MKMKMKRSREVDVAEMATCLMLLSRVGKLDTDRPRVFSCKTCNRQFASFQALGGHRTSHKKPRLTSDGDESPSPAKAKTHECSICGLEFPIGQALGGHMRRHRNAATAGRETSPDQELLSKRAACLDLTLAPGGIDLNLHLGLVL